MEADRLCAAWKFPRISCYYYYLDLHLTKTYPTKMKIMMALRKYTRLLISLVSILPMSCKVGAVNWASVTKVLKWTQSRVGSATAILIPRVTWEATDNLFNTEVLIWDFFRSRGILYVDLTWITSPLQTRDKILREKKIDSKWKQEFWSLLLLLLLSLTTFQRTRFKYSWKKVMHGQVSGTVKACEANCGVQTPKSVLKHNRQDN